MIISRMGTGIAAAFLSTAALAGSDFAWGEIEAEVASMTDQSQEAAVGDIKWIVSETFEWHDIKGDDLYVFDTEFALRFGEDTEISLGVPVYNQGGSTSVGSLRFGGEVDAFDGENDVLGEWNLALGGGVYVPVGSPSFDSQNFDPFLSAKFGCKLWWFDFVQTVEYRWVGGEAYSTWLGAKTDSDLLVLGSLLAYSWGDLGVGADFTQVYYVGNDESQLFLGPAAYWNVTSNVSVTAVVDFPLTQDVSVAETDVITSINLGIHF